MTTNDQLLARTLGPRESEVLAWLESERRRSVTIDEAAAALGWSSKRTREVFARLARKGWLKRLARGRYETVLAETGGLDAAEPMGGAEPLATAVLRRLPVGGIRARAHSRSSGRGAGVRPGGREATACMGRRADRGSSTSGRSRSREPSRRRCMAFPWRSSRPRSCSPTRRPYRPGWAESSVC